MRWRVSMLCTDDGSIPDDVFRSGVVIEDRRESAHDLVQQANDHWGTFALDGEVYMIEACVPTRTVAVIGGEGHKFTIKDTDS